MAVLVRRGTLDHAAISARRGRRKTGSSRRNAALAAVSLLLPITGVAAVWGNETPPPHPESFTWAGGLVHRTGVTGNRNSIAVAPNGTAWVAFQDASSNRDLFVATTATSGGCNADATWACRVVEGDGGGAADTGYLPSIAVSPAGIVHVAYLNATSRTLRHASFDGASWSVTPVAIMATTSAQVTGTQSGPSIALDPAGSPVIAFYNLTSTDLYLARYLGAGGTGCLTSAWSCRAVESVAGATGQFPSLKVDPSGAIHLAHVNQTTTPWRLRYVKSVVSSGNCGSGLYACTSVDDVRTTGAALRSISLALNLTGVPRISYFGNVNSGAMKFAKLVGAGGSCPYSGAWSCGLIQAPPTFFQGAGRASSMVVDDQDREHVVFRDYDTNAESDVWAAHLTGGGGNCASNASWDCEILQGIADLPSLALGPDGRLFCAYDDQLSGFEGMSVESTVASVPEGSRIPFVAGLAAAVCFGGVSRTRRLRRGPADPRRA